MPLYTRESGPITAPTIVFLHGAGLSGQQWQPQMEALTEFHCLAPDLPAQGRSRACGPLTLESAVQGVLEVMTTLGVSGSAHLVGSSLGATIALQLLQCAPKRFASALLSGGSAGLGAGLGRLSLAAGVAYRFLPADTLVRLSLRQFGIPERYRGLVQGDLVSTATEAFNRQVVTTMMQSRFPVDTQVPVLAVAGQRETWFARQAARRIARQVPTAQAVMAPGVGHLWNLQAPALFTEVVRAWVGQGQVVSSLIPLY